MPNARSRQQQANAAPRATTSVPGQKPDPAGPGRGDFQAYLELLDLRFEDLAEAVREVEAGLPYSALSHLQENLAAPLAEIASLIHTSERTLSRRKKSKRLSPDESDRLLRAARVLGRARDLFEGDFEAARRWIGNPSVALGGATPLEFAATEIGAREVEDLIGRLEHGVFS